MDDNETGCSFGLIVAEEEVVEEGNSEVVSPASKLLVAKPEIPTMMKNHNDTLYLNGYDSDSDLRFFNPISDTGKDPANC